MRGFFQVSGPTMPSGASPYPRGEQRCLATPMTALVPPHDPGDVRACLIPADGRPLCFTGG